MSDWTDGYVADLTYTHGFYREQTPALLNLGAILRGHEPPAIDRPFTYCELGCGQGVTMSLLAAANPQGQFWGTDFNPSHAAWASKLTADAGITNAKFFDKSFAEFLDLDTPDFDYVTLHGIYSWVSAENRQQIVNVISKKLKYGGVVYISYNALPGWASAMPLRQLLVEHASRSTEPSLQRVDKALAFIDQLRDSKAAYFGSNPTIGNRLDSMKKLSRSYLVHEYMNKDWTPFYFSQVAKELGAAKLSFAGSAHIGDHLDSVALPAKSNQMIEGIADPVLRETVRDYMLNQQFRRDIFLKGSTPLAPTRRQTLLRNFRFALTSPKEEVPLEVTFPIGKCKLVPDIYQPIIDTLAKGPATLGDLATLPALSKLDSSRLVQAMMIMVSGGHVSPALAAEGDAARKQVSDRMNGVVMERSAWSDDLKTMASPVVGSGVPVNRLDALFMLAHRNKKDPASFAWDILAPQGVKFLREGQQLKTPEENLAEMSVRAKDFDTKRRPIYRNLGIS